MALTRKTYDSRFLTTNDVAKAVGKANTTILHILAGRFGTSSPIPKPDIPSDGGRMPHLWLANGEIKKWIEENKPAPKTKAQPAQSAEHEHSKLVIGLLQRVTELENKQKCLIKRIQTLEEKAGIKFELEESRKDEYEWIG